jgi:hypothetical protein
MPARFINVSNSGQARFTNVSNSGRAVFGVSTGTITTTTTTAGNYLINIFARLTSVTGEGYQFQYNLNNTSFVNIGDPVTGTACGSVGSIAVSTSGTDDVVIRVVLSETSTTYSFTMDLTSNICPTYNDPTYGISCNRQINNVSATRNVAATISSGTTC